MGFTSYLEDIIEKSETYEHYLSEYNKDKIGTEKISIANILEFRKDCINLLKKIESLNIENFDDIIAENLRLKNENKKLRNFKAIHQTSFENSEKKIAKLERTIKELKSENASYVEKIKEQKQNQKNEALNRQEFEEMIESRYYNLYQNKLNLSAKELSDFKFDIHDQISKVLRIIKPQYLNSSPKLKYIVNDILLKCE